MIIKGYLIVQCTKTEIIRQTLIKYNVYIKYNIATQTRPPSHETSQSHYRSIQQLRRKKYPYEKELFKFNKLIMQSLLDFFSYYTM